MLNFKVIFTSKYYANPVCTLTLRHLSDKWKKINYKNDSLCVHKDVGKCSKYKDCYAIRSMKVKHNKQINIF